ncbi:hypothetical protein [Metasolibacillus fluoroglycofenilyticus]|uniref:hypothetical protein n=1 Tax=Metasolibacillus fluoroglycofenilyticus TaxID=1239396 RepID=UPI000D3C5670|nr:hypothetical protein [Metasolibacillus fluoroglycofenilyticus]
MPAYLKLLPLVVIALIFITVMHYIGSTQNISTRTVAETDGIMEMANIGVARAEINQEGNLQNEESYFAKEELLQNLAMELAAAQKNLPYDVKVDYVFTDKKGQITENQLEIRGIHYRMQYVDEDGNVKGTAEKHLALNELLK